MLYILATCLLVGVASNSISFSSISFGGISSNIALCLVTSVTRLLSLKQNMLLFVDILGTATEPTGIAGKD